MAKVYWRPERDTTNFTVWCHLTHMQRAIYFVWDASMPQRIMGNLCVILLCLHNNVKLYHMVLLWNMKPRWGCWSPQPALVYALNPRCAHCGLLSWPLRRRSWEGLRMSTRRRKKVKSGVWKNILAIKVWGVGHNKVNKVCSVYAKFDFKVQQENRLENSNSWIVHVILLNGLL